MSPKICGECYYFHEAGGKCLYDHRRTNIFKKACKHFISLESLYDRDMPTEFLECSEDLEVEDGTVFL